MDRADNVPGTDGTLWGENVCTVCGAGEFLDFLEIRGIAAQDGVLWPTHAEAVNAPRGDITLGLCLQCGYAGNRTFQPDLLKFTGYNVSLEYSPLYRNFIQALAARLIARYGIRHKTVLDIGCGNGYFLKTICALGKNRGVGFDPSYQDVDGGTDAAREILFINEYYSEHSARHDGDLVCCRQVIDHLGDPKAFLKMVRRQIGDRTDSVVYFEVPNPERRLQQFEPWNVGYEHGSWFFPDSFRLLFESSGFAVLDVSPCHDGDYLGIDAIPIVPAAPPAPAGRAGTASPGIDTGRLADDLRSLSRRCRETISAWEARLREMQSNGIRAIPWGAGERGIGFLNILDVRETMPFIVDINPGRIGKFLPGTGQKVVPPEFLVEYTPDLIIITNSTYALEIQEHAGKLGVACDFLIL